MTSPLVIFGSLGMIVSSFSSRIQLATSFVDSLPCSGVSTVAPVGRTPSRARECQSHGPTSTSEATPPWSQQPGGEYIYIPRNDTWSCFRAK